MRILILHRVPFAYIKYDRVIDHVEHDVVYVGTREALANVPEGLRCTRVERPGEGAVAAEVIAIFGGAVDRFDRVISMSQFEAMDAAKVREALGVVGLTTADVIRADHKIAMKRAVQAKGLRAPRFLPCREAMSGPAAWSGRTVLKPVDGSGSRNVHVFETFEAAQRALADGSIADLDLGRFEVEEFLEGPIYHCDGLMLAGEPIVILASRYVGTCLGFANGEALGSVQLPADTAVCDATLEFLDAVGLKNGAFHLELIETRGGPDRELAFLEVGNRSGGADIVEVIRRATGVDLVTAALLLDVDARPLADNSARERLTPHGPKHGAETFGFFLFPGHKIGATHGRVVGTEAFRDRPEIVKWKELEPGAPLPTKITYFDFELPLSGIVAGATAAEVEGLISRIIADVHIVPA